MSLPDRTASKLATVQTRHSGPRFFGHLRLRIQLLAVSLKLSSICLMITAGGFDPGFKESIYSTTLEDSPDK